MSDQPLWNPAWVPDISDPGLSHYGIGLGRTCLGWGPYMSGQSHWNPATELDKVERPDMSSLGVRHAWTESLKSG
jgi:hypothetical protein